MGHEIILDGRDYQLWGAEEGLEPVRGNEFVPAHDTTQEPIHGSDGIQAGSQQPCQSIQRFYGKGGFIHKMSD